MIRQLLYLIAAACALLHLTMAAPTTIGLDKRSCSMKNKLPKHGDKETDRRFCKPTGNPNRFVFGMQTSLISVPTFNSGNALAGTAGSKGFVLYNHKCIPIGSYGPSGNDCGTPYWIKNGALPYQIKVNNINWGLGAAYFKFAYANGEYMTSENDGECHDVSSGLKGAQACMASFPIHGER